MKVIPFEGGLITQPGIYSGIPMDAYHGNLCDGPSVSSTGLRRILLESPAHFFDKSWFHDEPSPDEPTADMIRGRAAHWLFAGEDGFSDHFAVEPEFYSTAKGEVKPWNNNATMCRLWHAEQKGDGKTILTRKVLDDVRGVVNAVERSPERDILNGMAELSYIFRDEPTGIWIKSRPDVTYGGSDIVDFKLMADVSDDGVERAIGRGGLHMQGALAAAAFTTLTGEKPSSVSLFIVESTRPHCIRVDGLADEDLALGAKQNRAALDLMAWCLARDEWPGPRNWNGTGGISHMKDWDRKTGEFRIDVANRIMREAA